MSLPSGLEGTGVWLATFWRTARPHKKAAIISISTIDFEINLWAVRGNYERAWQASGHVGTGCHVGTTAVYRYGLRVYGGRRRRDARPLEPRAGSDKKSAGMRTEATDLLSEKDVSLPQ